MSELDRVLDIFIEAKRASIVGKTSKEDEKELVDALKEKKKAQIIEEIQVLCSNEIVERAEKEIAKKAHEKQIKELKNLMWSGFALAFVVGLAVNQVTDIIGYYKGSVTLDAIWPTYIIATAFILICFGFYFYNFLVNALSLVDKKE